MKLRPYRTWLFDCDGVILDSNALKTAAFHELVLPFGEDIARAFVAHHVAYGGVSRIAKLRYLFEHLLERPAEDAAIAKLARDYGSLIRAKLLACPEVPGLRDLLAKRPAGSRSFVVSGADQVELRDILAVRGLAEFFDGIHGGPRTKAQILSELPVDDAVFLGDSRYDHQTAASFGIDFVFVSGCSELENWPAYIEEHGVRAVSDLGQLDVA